MRVHCQKRTFTDRHSRRDRPVRVIFKHLSPRCELNNILAVHSQNLIPTLTYLSVVDVDRCQDILFRVGVDQRPRRTALASG